MDHLMPLSGDDTVAAIESANRKDLFTDVEFWTSKAYYNYGIPLASVDSTILVYSDVRYKYLELESVMQDRDILADLKTLRSFYPLLGQIILQQGSRGIEDGVADVEQMLVPVGLQAAIELVGYYSPTYLYTQYHKAGQDEKARTVHQLFYLMDEKAILDSYPLPPVAKPSGVVSPIPKRVLKSNVVE